MPATDLLHKTGVHQLLSAFIYCIISFLNSSPSSENSRLAQWTIEVDLLSIFFFFHKRIRLNFCCQIVLPACVYSFACLCEAEKHWHLLWIKITVKTSIWKGLWACCLAAASTQGFESFWMIVYCSWRQEGVGVPSWLPASTAACSLCKGRSTSPAFNRSLAMSLSEMQPSWARFGWLCAFPHGQKDSSTSSTRIWTGTEKEWHDRLHSTLERGSKRWIKYSCTHIEKTTMPHLMRLHLLFTIYWICSWSTSVWGTKY